ncbi:MAG TPA: right-handed parallel beta-helix repeat-containing protein [Pyrinomonadaceae bacterium]|nr:right-handed parallel beta-helix repeat-containing protein [Pyrinomonadaceae bacterium]
MSANLPNVRAKRRDAPRRAGVSVWMFVAGILLFAVAATLGFDLYSGKLGIIGPRFEIVQNGAARIIKVPPGGNVQAALEQANSGDIVELQAGAVYFGEIKLPNKPLADFVTIQSSAAASLLPDKRVGPNQASSMAKIESRGGGKPAVSAANGANHYRFVGIEFTAGNAEYNYNLILFGNGEPEAKLPHDLEIDRSYLHPFKTGVVRRGIALNSANTNVKNSYIEGFGYPSEEAQGIAGWTGTRNIKIINNYIEGGAENILFGGSDPTSADLIPSDIEIRGNHLRKPREWNGKAALKTLFELKNAKRVQFTGNYLEDNWAGPAFRITIRNQDGAAPFSTIEDVLISNNIINRAADGINILGKDDTHPSQTLKHLRIENNLFLGVNGGGEYDGSGYFFQIADGEDITIVNNTVFNNGNVAKFHDAPPRGLIVRDNLVGHGDYGIHGIDNRSADSRSIFQGNIFMNINRVPPSDYAFPSGNSIVGGMNDIGFINVAGNDYRLSTGSKFKGKGCDFTKMPPDLMRYISK